VLAVPIGDGGRVADVPPMDPAAALHDPGQKQCLRIGVGRRPEPSVIEHRWLNHEHRVDVMGHELHLFIAQALLPDLAVLGDPLGLDLRFAVAGGLVALGQAAPGQKEKECPVLTPAGLLVMLRHKERMQAV